MSFGPSLPCLIRSSSSNLVLSNLLFRRITATHPEDAIYYSYATHLLVSTPPPFYDPPLAFKVIGIHIEVRHVISYSWRTLFFLTILLFLISANICSALVKNCSTLLLL